MTLRKLRGTESETNGMVGRLTIAYIRQAIIVDRCEILASKKYRYGGLNLSVESL